VGTLDKDHIREALIDRRQDLYRDAWGEPENQHAREWRAKSDTARWMDMQAQPGRWQDHKTGQKGDILDFFAVQLCGLDRAGQDFPRVLAEAARWAGIDTAVSFDRAEMEARQVARRIEAEAAEAREAAQKAATVTKLIRHAEPVSGSAAEMYLASRGITADSWPDALAYAPPMPRGTGVLHPDLAALAVWATDDAGKIMGGQRVLIMPDGSKASEETRKPSFGSIAGYPARFKARIEGGPLCIAEGPETALSVWLATGFETWAVFGSGQFQTAPVPTGRKVVFCPDRDAPDSPAAQAFQKALKIHAERRVQVWIAEAPEGEDSADDLNDTLQRAGVSEVAEAIANAKPLQPPEKGEPLPILPSVTETRTALNEALSGFWHTARDNPEPPFQVIRVPVGTGKTRGMIETVGKVIADLRAQGDKRAVLIYAPDHKLNDQIKDDFSRYAPSVTVAVRRGREANNPDAPDEQMCRNLGEVNRAQKFLLDVSGIVCASCPFAATCAYLKSKSVMADVYIMPHAALPLKPPATGEKFGQGIAFVVVDESPTLIRTATEIPVAAFDGMRATQRKRKDETIDAALGREADLRAVRAKLADLSESNGEGPLKADLVRARFDAETLRHAAKAEWDRKINDAARPDAELEHNRTVTRMSAIFHELADLIDDGRPVTSRLVVQKDAERGLILRIRTLGKLHDELKEAPLLLLDATAQRPMIEATIHTPSTWTELETAAPHMRIAQDASVSLSMSMLQADLTGKGSQAARKAAPTNREKLIRLSCEQFAKFGKQPGLIVTYKAAADAIRPFVPKGVAVMHFGATRGRNNAEGVRWILIAGRLWASDQDVIEQAETLTGLPVEREAQEIAVERLFTDGCRQWGNPCNVRGFSDQMAQACLDRIRDAELIQAIGRGRGVNRTEADPLDVLVIGDGFLPFAVHDAAGAWDAMPKRNVIGAQIELGGIAYAGAAAAFAAYGKALSPSQDALKTEIRRLGDIPLLGSYRALSPSPMTLIRLRRDKRAPSWTEALVDLAQHPDPRSAIEAQLGELAAFEVVPCPEQEQPSAEGKKLILLPSGDWRPSALLNDLLNARRGLPRMLQPRSRWKVTDLGVFRIAADVLSAVEHAILWPGDAVTGIAHVLRSVSPVSSAIAA